MPIDSSLARSYSMWTTTYSTVAGDLDALLKNELNLNITQACVVFVATGHEDGVKMGTLAKESYLRPNTATAAVNQLEELGLLERRSNATDKRSILVHVTDKGLETFDAIINVMKVYIERFNDVLTDEEKHQVREPLFCFSGYKKLSGLREPLATETACIIAARNVLIAIGDFMKGIGLTLTEGRVIYYLKYGNEGTRLSDISDALCLRQNILTLCIDKLEARGLVKRTTNASDRRAINVSTLKSGNKLATMIYDQFTTFYENNDVALEKEPPEALRRFLFKTINEA